MAYPLYLPPGVEDAVRRAVSRTAGRNTAIVERALWITSVIAQRSQLPGLVRSGFALTSYDYLERGCPRKQISGCLTILRAAGVIERDNYYLPAARDPTGEGKSYGYRLAEPYRGRKLVRGRGGSLAVDESLQASFRQREQNRKDEPLGWPYGELDRMAKRIRLVPNPDGPDMADDMMEPSNRWGLVDPFGQRFHETHQAIGRGIRHRLRIGNAGEPPFVLDIGSSQPLILTWKVKEEARRRAAGRRRRGDGDGDGGRQGGRRRGAGAEAARDHNEWPDLDNLLSDVRQVQELCIDGHLSTRAGMRRMFHAPHPPQ